MRAVVVKPRTTTRFPTKYALVWQDPGCPTLTRVHRWWVRLPAMWASISPRAAVALHPGTAHSTGSRRHTPMCASTSPRTSAAPQPRGHSTGQRSHCESCACASVARRNTKGEVRTKSGRKGERRYKRVHCAAERRRKLLRTATDLHRAALKWRTAVATGHQRERTPRRVA